MDGELAGYLTPELFRTPTCAIRHHMGGHFQATAEQLDNVPLSVYKRLFGLQQSANAEVDHFVERLWGPMMCAPTGYFKRTIRKSVRKMAYVNKVSQF